MKKIIVFIILLFTEILPVYAKDTIYSINRYSDEVFDSILKSEDDGYVMSGTFSKKEKIIDEEDDDEEEEIFTHTQIMTVKYKKTGEVDWSYYYGKTGDDEFYQMTYSYDDEKNCTGYVLLVRESVDRNMEQRDILTYVFLDLEGNLVKEEQSNIHGSVDSILEIKDSGYLITGIDQNHHSFMAQLDYHFQVTWMKDYSDYSNIKEVIFLDHFYYALVLKDESYQLLKMDSMGNVISVLKENFESIDSPHIVSSVDSFILYGFTGEVKLSKKEDASYYLNQYDKDGNVLWDSIGNVEVNINDIIQLQPIVVEDKIQEYQLLYINGSDGSIEIVRIDTEGFIRNKIKKIKNNYYHVHAFLSDSNILYFIGQINCPDDDNCDYDTNSLFLISDEDKVIEVKDNDSKRILVVLGFIILIIVGLLLIKKKQK